VTGGNGMADGAAGVIANQGDLLEVQSPERAGDQVG